MNKLIVNLMIVFATAFLFVSVAEAKKGGFTFSKASGVKPTFTPKATPPKTTIPKKTNPSSSPVISKPKFWKADVKGTKTAGTKAIEHFHKHKGDFPHIKTAVQYVKETNKFIQTPPKGTLIKTRRNGDKVYYNPSSNTFAIQDKDGSPRTMYKPDPKQHGKNTNLEYFYEEANK